VTIALLVALAGGLGAVARYAADGSVQHRVARRLGHPGAFPLGTLLINAAGSLVLGLVTGLVWYHGASADVRLVVGTGACGGFTTWSTASFESVRLVEEGLVARAALFTLGGLAVALAAATVGIAVATL